MDRRIIPLLLPALLSGCASYSLKGSDDEGTYAPEDADGETNWADTGSVDDGWGSEDESDFLGLRPATTDAYVFVVNTERDTVTRISVPSLQVVTASVGVRPSVVVTTADYSRAVTFNEGSDDLSVIDTDTLDVVSVEVRSNLNQMKVSPDGRWAICYHDISAEDDTDPDGSISYNEISIVDLDSLVHHQAVVGTFPHDVQFTDDSTQAVVVSDDYLAVLDLTAETIEPERIALSDELIDPPEAEEVLLDPLGQYAIVRQYGVDELILVDLDSRLTEALPVGDNPTDMDLSADGLDAIVVARGSGELWIYDLTDPTAEPEVITMPAGEIFGSLLVSPDNNKGLLYSTVSGLSRYGVWDRSTGEVVVNQLVKPVAGIGVSPTGGTALIFHTLDNGDIDPDSVFYDQPALTMIDLDDFFPNPIQLTAEPTAYANAADGETGYFIMDGAPYLGVLDYSTLLHDTLPLPSDPVYLGTLPDTNTAYISQEHELGRISFYNPDAGPDETTLQTVTGFELNSQIDP